MDAVTTAPFIPPRPTVPQHELALFPFLRAIRTNALSMWTERAYQETVLVRRLVTRTNILLNDPDGIHHVLVDNHTNYRRSPASIRILRPITGYGLLLSEGEAWRHQRRTTAPALSPRVMPVLARHIVISVRQQIETLAARADAPVDMLAAMRNLALDVAGRSMFSLEMQHYGAAMRRQLDQYGMRLSRPNLWDMLLPASVPTPRDLQRRLFQSRWMGLIETMMRERMSAPQPETSRDLFDLLRAARDPETGAAFSPAQLRDQLATLILAGHETTAVTLFWCLALLAQDTNEQARVAAEAERVAIEPDSATVVLPDLVRTRAVISETLRLYPPAFVIVREAMAPDRVVDVEVPRRGVVMIAPWVLHRHQRLWRDPDAFDPGQFLPGAPPPARFAYLPFGVGPRVCVGAQFALTEATLALAMLLRRFRVTLEDEPPVPAAVITTQASRPAAFRLHPR